MRYPSCGLWGFGLLCRTADSQGVAHQGMSARRASQPPAATEVRRLLHGLADVGLLHTLGDGAAGSRLRELWGEARQLVGFVDGEAE